MFEIQYSNLFNFLHFYYSHSNKIKEMYLLLLSELTVTYDLQDELFYENLEKITDIGSIIIAYVSYPHESDFKIVGTGTIIMEPKIIRGGKKVGHIEDIVVTKEMRGKGISQKILDLLKLIARENNCYKVILDCSEEVKEVYIKNGFEIKGIQMAEYFS